MITETQNYHQLYQDYIRIKRKEHHLQIINDFALSLLEQNTVYDIVWVIAKKVVAQLGFVDCVIYLLDEERQVLIQHAAHGPKNPQALDIYNPIEIPIGKGIVGTVAISGTPEIINDTSTDARYILDDNFRLSEIAVPILFENKVIGVIDSENPERDFFTEEHLSLLTTIAAIGATKIMHSRTTEQLQCYKNNLEEKVEAQTLELKQNIYHLQRSNKDLESFAYAASHDLQEPLRTMISYLQLLYKTENQLSEQGQEFLNFAINGSKRMKMLLDGLLEYSQLSNEDGTKDEIKMEEVLILIKANLHAAIQKKDAQIEYEDDLPSIFGNRVQIIQLFQNIIANAIKFVPEDRQPHIRVNARADAKGVHFEIIDNGIGIAPEFHEKVFGLFNRLNRRDKFVGSGIGLALCKRIVDYHRGQINICSEYKDGTCFLLYFPYLK